MLLPNLTFLLLIMIEGCAGPLPDGQSCTAKNFSLRIPYDKLEQCEAAKKGLTAPSGVQQFIMAQCLAVPKEKK